MSIKNNKYIVEVDRDAKRLKRIFDDLRVHGECIIDGYDKEWNNPLRKYGHMIKKHSLVDDGLIEPMWVHINRSNSVTENRLIRLRPNTVVECIPGNKKVYFKFKRRKPF